MGKGVEITEAFFLDGGVDFFEDMVSGKMIFQSSGDWWNV